MRWMLRGLAAVLAMGLGTVAMGAAAAPVAPVGPVSPAVAPAVPAAADYEIRLSRPAKVGDESREAGTAQRLMKNTTKAGEKVLQERAQQTSIDFDISGKVLEVNAKGGATKVSVTIEKFVVKEGGAGETSPLAKGTVVVASVKDKEEVFEVDGKPVAPEIAEALGTVISLSKGGSSDDDVLGTKDRQKVGDRWNVNADLALKDLEDQIQMKVSKDDFKGYMTLVQVVKVGAVECLDLRGELTIGKFSPPNLPPGFTVEKASLLMRFAGKFPVDVAKSRIEESLEMNMTLVLKGKPDPAGPEVTNETVMTQTRTSRYTYDK